MVDIWDLTVIFNKTCITCRDLLVSFVVELYYFNCERLQKKKKMTEMCYRSEMLHTHTQKKTVDFSMSTERIFRKNYLL